MTKCLFKNSFEGPTTMEYVKINGLARLPHRIGHLVHRRLEGVNPQMAASIRLIKALGGGWNS